MIIFDKFQPNFLEMDGKITRNPFQFIGDSCKVWHRGQEIFQSNAKYNISSILDEETGNLNVTLNNEGIDKFVVNTFNFNEISYTIDRILWSKDIELGGANMSRLQPGNMSLFYCNGILRRIYLNVYLPFEIMIEFNSEGNNDISEVENPLKKIAGELNRISPYNRDLAENYKIGYEKMELGDFESAISFFDLVIHQDANYKLAYYYRGFSKFHLNLYLEAIGDYTSAIELDPSNSVAYFGRGYSKFRLQDFNGAIIDLNTAIEIKSDDSDYYGVRGISRSNLHQFKESIDDYNQQIRLNPNNPKVYFNRGISRYNEGDENGAFNDWKIAGDMGLQEGYDILEKHRH